MDQVQVNDIQSQLFPAYLKGPQRRFIALVGVAHLGRNEQLIPRYSAFPDGLSDAFFIIVTGRCINAAVSRFDSCLHCTNDFFTVFGLPYPKPEPGHCSSVI
ncbi:hypothetical protein D3C73_1017410 [compost metagenome]